MFQLRQYLHTYLLRQCLPIYLLRQYLPIYLLKENLSNISVSVVPDYLFALAVLIQCICIGSIYLSISLTVPTYLSTLAVPFLPLCFGSTYRYLSISFGSTTCRSALQYLSIYLLWQYLSSIQLPTFSATLPPSRPTSSWLLMATSLRVDQGKEATLAEQELCQDAAWGGPCSPILLCR